MTNTAVEIRNLTKVFDGKEVLRGCNLTVQSGTIYGLLGANGAGKLAVPDRRKHKSAGGNIID